MPDCSRPLAGRRALVVDDDPVVRVLAVDALTELGFAVEELPDGTSALAAVQRCWPDLILLDVEMPGLDGFETCAALRRQPEAPEIPILIATGHTDPATIDQAFEVGATDFIGKPLDWQLLQHRVRFVMRAYDAFHRLRNTLQDFVASQARLANAQRLARLGNWEWVIGEESMLWSEELYRILGIPPRPGRSTRATLIDAVHPDDRESVEKALQRSASEAEGWNLDHRVVTAAGEIRSVQHQVEVVLGPSGAPDRIWGTVQDVTDRMRAEQQIRYLSYFDSLTALPNRRMLMEHLGRVLGHAIRCGEAVAVLCLDLDRFNRINDTFGHAIGDECLKAVAEQLMDCVRSTDYVGRASPEGPLVSRLGGDEYMVVLRDVGGPEGASVAARRLLDVLKRPFAVPGGEIVMSATIGIALHPFDGSDGETLVANAEAAMYAAKRENRNSYQFFNDSMNRRALRELLLERSLEGAAERHELAVHYQPVIDTETGCLVGVEALLRWASGEFGMVPPAEFIPLAEETGRIVTLGEWVLRTSCQQLGAWRAAGLSPLRLAVNVSNHQLRRPDFVEIIEATLRECGMEPSSLELEITESALVRDEPIVVESLGRLRRMGVRIALDDFGTGYSSLSHLVRFPIDIIKIDRSFVQRCGPGEQGSAIVAAVIAMARHLRLQVTAEGVETGAQEAFLRDQGCHMLQGFRFARPLEPEALLSWQRGEEGPGASSGR